MPRLGGWTEEGFKKYFGVNAKICFAVGSPNYNMARQLAGSSLKKRDFWANVYI